MNYAAFIEENRRKHHQARWVLHNFRHLGDSATSAGADVLFARGRVGWCVVVKAGNALHEPGLIASHPACVVCDFDGSYDHRVDDLVKAGDSVRALYGQTPADPALYAFAAVVNDDRSPVVRQAVPGSIAPDLCYLDLSIQRHRLPTGFLTLRVLPVVTSAHQLPYAMVLPLEFWADGLVEAWKAIAPPPLPRPGMACGKLAEFISSPVVLSEAAANEVRSILRKQNMPAGRLRIITKNGAFSLDISDSQPDPFDDLTYMSHGVNLVVHKDSAAGLVGVVVDYRSEGGQKGFVFDRGRG